MVHPIPCNESTVNQFNRLIRDVLSGGVQRNHFQPWEVTLLMDMNQCDLPKGRRFEVLRRYQKAVNRAYEHGSPVLLTLSDYLQRSRRRQESAA